MERSLTPVEIGVRRPDKKVYLWFYPRSVHEAGSGEVFSLPVVHIKLNPEFDQYIDFYGSTDRLSSSLFNTFHSMVTRAPERAIRTYLEVNFGTDPFADTDWKLEEDN